MTRELHSIESGMARLVGRIFLAHL
jgi:hypothetical protein